MTKGSTNKLRVKARRLVFTVECVETQDAFMMNPLFYRLRMGSVGGGDRLARDNGGDAKEPRTEGPR